MIRKPVFLGNISMQDRYEDWKISINALSTVMPL